MSNFNVTPISALVVTVVSALVAVLFTSTLAILAYCLACVAALSLLTQSVVPAKQVLFWMLPFVVPLIAIHGLLNPTFPVSGWLHNAVPYRLAGIEFAATTSIHLLVLITCASTWLAVRKDEAIDGLFQLRLPLSLTIIGAQGIAMVDLVRRRVEQVYLAQRARGVPVDSGLWARIRAFPTIIVPVTISILSEADYRAICLSSRGFGSARPVPAKKLSLQFSDLVMGLTTAGCFCVGLAVEVAR